MERKWKDGQGDEIIIDEDGYNGKPPTLVHIKTSEYGASFDLPTLTDIRAHLDVLAREVFGETEKPIRISDDLRREIWTAIAEDDSFPNPDADGGLSVAQIDRLVDTAIAVIENLTTAVEVQK